jgi:hypothetical protein
VRGRKPRPKKGTEYKLKGVLIMDYNKMYCTNDELDKMVREMTSNGWKMFAHEHPENNTVIDIIDGFQIITEGVKFQQKYLYKDGHTLGTCAGYRFWKINQKGGMKMLKTIEKLSRTAPNAVFTKAEAAAKSRQIITEILADDCNDDYNELLFKVDLSSEDFDTDCNYDILLDDVAFVTWDVIDAVIGAKLAELEAK